MSASSSVRSWLRASESVHAADEPTPQFQPQSQRYKRPKLNELALPPPSQQPVITNILHKYEPVKLPLPQPPASSSSLNEERKAKPDVVAREDASSEDSFNDQSDDDDIPPSPLSDERKQAAPSGAVTGADGKAAKPARAKKREKKDVDGSPILKAKGVKRKRPEKDPVATSVDRVIAKVQGSAVTDPSNIPQLPTTEPQSPPSSSPLHPMTVLQVMQEQKESPIVQLPIDVLQSISAFLVAKELFSLSRTSQELRPICLDDAMWRPMIAQIWPIECPHDEKHSHPWFKVYWNRLKAAIVNHYEYFCHHCSCSEAFAQSETLERHRTNNHRTPSSNVDGAALTKTGKVKRFTCTQDGCDKSYHHRWLLARHQKLHTGARAFICDHPGCAHSFESQFQLQQHQCRHTGKKKRYPCPHDSCSASFSRPFALRQHIKQHAVSVKERKDYPCQHPGCSKSYVGLQMLKKHVAMVHDKEQLRFACEKCPSKFYYRANLKEHLYREHDDKSRDASVSKNRMVTRKLGESGTSDDEEIKNGEERLPLLPVLPTVESTASAIGNDANNIASAITSASSATTANSSRSAEPAIVEERKEN